MSSLLLFHDPHRVIVYFGMRPRVLFSPRSFSPKTVACLLVWLTEHPCIQARWGEYTYLSWRVAFTETLYPQRFAWFASSIRNSSLDVAIAHSLEACPPFPVASLLFLLIPFVSEHNTTVRARAGGFAGFAYFYLIHFSRGHGLASEKSLQNSNLSSVY